MDFGGFLLYDSKGPVLVDRGRHSYNSDSMGEYGLSARAHNTTLINGLPIVPDCRGLFFAYKGGLLDGTKVTFSNMGGERKISWQSDGLNRFGRSLKWTRDILVGCEGMNIAETLSNASRATLTIESYLHWAPGWEMRPHARGSSSGSRFLIVKDGRGYRLRIECSGTDSTVDWFTGEEDSPLGWHFPDYGARVPALTMRVAFKCSGDCELRFAICPV